MRVTKAISELDRLRIEFQKAESTYKRAKDKNENYKGVLKSDYDLALQRLQRAEKAALQGWKP